MKSRKQRQALNQYIGQGFKKDKTRRNIYSKQEVYRAIGMHS